MFEAIELGHKVDKQEYDRELPDLRVDLLNMQYELRKSERPFPVIVIISGDDRIGFNETIDLIHEWMDARYIDTHALGPPTDEERQRPEFWRYWMSLPSRGRIGVYAGGWMLRAIRDRLGKRIKKAQFERALERIARFEKALVDDGFVILKFWMHIGKKAHAKRLARAKKDPERGWRVDEVDQRIYDNYDRAIGTIERALRKTSSVEAPWHVIESVDPRYRNLQVGRLIRDGVDRRLQEIRDGEVKETRPPAVPAPIVDGDDVRTILDTVDLTRSIAKPKYDEVLREQQARLHRLAREAVDASLSSVLVFEGWDAAGKGGVIRRMTRAMNPRFYRVIPIAAPTPEELAHHYLWRFWNKLPGAGRMVIFDRSWYGRVLVERVEGFASESEWRRAYGEINEFEEQLVEHGVLLLKFWLHIDQEEQWQRFKQREDTPFKKYKMTPEDYRNRERWVAYELAVNDMVARTSTEFAPWHLVPANDKRYARIDVIDTLCDALENRS